MKFKLIDVYNNDIEEEIEVSFMDGKIWIISKNHEDKFGDHSIGVIELAEGLKISIWNNKANEDPKIISFECAETQSYKINKNKDSFLESCKKKD